MEILFLHRIVYMLPNCSAFTRHRFGNQHHIVVPQGGPLFPTNDIFFICSDRIVFKLPT